MVTQRLIDARRIVDISHAVTATSRIKDGARGIKDFVFVMGVNVSTFQLLHPSSHRQIHFTCYEPTNSFPGIYPSAPVPAKG